MATGSVAPITPDARRARLAAEVRDAASRKGALLIPAFAVERTQELIVDLVDLMERGEVPAAPIFLDSPLAIRATEVFRKHASSLDPAIDVRRLLELTATAVHRNGGREQGDRQADRFSHCHRRQRHVRRRTYPAPSEELAVERAGHCPAGRLPGSGNTRPVSGRRRESRPYSGRRDQGRGANSQYRRLFRTCRRIGTGAMDRRASPDSARRVPGSWRGAGHRRPGGTHFRTDHTRGAGFSTAAGRHL